MKRKYIYNTVHIYWKKSAYKWTGTVQTHVVQTSIVLPCRTHVWVKYSIVDIIFEPDEWKY